MKFLYLTSLLLAITNLAIAASCSKKKVVGYFSEWRNANYPISKVDLSKLTHINYAFATIDPSSYALDGYDGNILNSVVSAAHKKGVKVLMSVGGWYGSRYFTKMTSSQSNMEKFAESCKKLVSQHNVDGIDIDWEYPGREGACNNPDISNDTDNYLKLLKILRSKLGSNVLITAAVSAIPFEKNNSSINDLSEFAKYFDFINLMAYDFAGGWSSVVSHHASLYDPEKGDKLSVATGVKNWTSRKFPAGKIVVGVPAYGKSWIASSSTKNGLYQSVSNGHPKGDHEDSNASWTNYCGQTESQYSSSWKYKNIRSEILKTNYTTPSSSNWIRKWDDNAKSPYLFNKSTKQFISYDDPNSIRHKAKYVVDNGYAGMMLWELENDTSNFEILSAVNKHLGCSGGSSGNTTGNGATTGNAATGNAATGNAATGNAATGNRAVAGNGAAANNAAAGNANGKINDANTSNNNIKVPTRNIDTNNQNINTQNGTPQNAAPQNIGTANNTLGQTAGQQTTGRIQNSDSITKGDLEDLMKLENGVSGVVSRCSLLSLYLILSILYFFW